MNSCIFTGRLTADPEMRSTQDGKFVASFTLAVDQGFGDKKTTSFFEFTAWEKQAESLGKYTGRGSKIAVMSYAKQERWEDRNGSKRSAVKFVCTAWEFADSKTEHKTEPKVDKDGYMDVTDTISEGLPFN